MKFVNFKDKNQGIFACLYILIAPYPAQAKESA